MLLCSSSGIDKIDGKEFIAVGSSTGEIYQVLINGTTYTKDLAF